MNILTMTLEQSHLELFRLTTVVAELTNANAYLKEQLEWFKKQLFGHKSEKAVDVTHVDQLSFKGFGELFPSQPKKIKNIPAHSRQERNRDGKDSITLPDDLPVERQFLDIPEEDKICPVTGKPLIKIGEEITSRLAHKPGNFFIKQIVRPKYALPAGSEGGIVTADLPESLLPRCQADESLLAELLVSKFCDYLPLYRQSEIFGREKVFISRQIMSQWTLRAAIALKPLYNVMLSLVLKSGNIFYDESPIMMLAPGTGKTHQAYMWVLVGGNSSDPGYRIYDFRTNRRHENAATMLKGYKGRLHSDKYGAYEALATQRGLVWCPCWGHVRRKFIEVESGDLIFRDKVLRQIRYLFMFERVAWARSPEERLRIRREKELPIIEQLITDIKERMLNGDALPKSKFKTALTYFFGLIPYLKNYTEHEWARLDNNVAERAVRPLAIGRKNWLFVGNETGGEAAAIVLSLVQSCRAFHVNPREYLEDVMRRLLSHNSQKLYELLPDQWSQHRPKPLA